MASRQNKKKHPVRAPGKKQPPQPLETKSASGDERKNMIMRYDPGRKILAQCLELVAAGDAGHFVENPAVQFTAGAKAGKFDNLWDDEYNLLLRRVERLSALWLEQPRRMAGDILLSFLEKANVPRNRLKAIAGPLMECYNREDDWLEVASGDDWFAVWDEEEAAALAPRRPAQIRDAIASRVIGQQDALKAAAMITHWPAGRTQDQRHILRPFRLREVRDMAMLIAGISRTGPHHRRQPHVRRGVGRIGPSQGRV